jgi:hypothetical protein
LVLGVLDLALLHQAVQALLL